MSNQQLSWVSPTLVVLAGGYEAAGGRVAGNLETQKTFVKHLSTPGYTSDNIYKMGTRFS